ncbi:hypothetical protein GOBAR_AA02401 [Gossypium barbadense]|uniref:Receptor-like serine/threonine-protein kinase n=1 Tax=Gossypium barbadense TaxID=3634 RepID=A0A2P5YRH7_GOSBA|nr:hypothetical protein GOBAR_AA02401 [Gossypium barbadense]
MRRSCRWLVLNTLSSILSCYTIFILFSALQGCFARDNITIKSGLADGQTLFSAGNRFELGFFGPSRGSNVKRYVGIWYASNPQIVVWVANRDNPVLDRTGVLSIANDQLKLSDEKGKIYWSTQRGAKRSNPVAKLNDTGNFILLDERLRVNLWESFTEPTDTFLFGMKIDAKFSLTSWSSEEDPSSGNFIFKQDQGGEQLVATTRNCGTCGTNSVPYPLSTGPKCGDPMYFSFHCNSDTGELSFMAPNGRYSVVTVNPDARTFVIQMKAEEANNCAALLASASRILQFNQSSPFNVTSSCSGELGNLTSDSTLEGTVEVEISWKPPLEPMCSSSADCKDWPHSTCNENKNGQRRCLCNSTYHWDGSVLNCTQEAGRLGESSDESKPLALILGISLPIGTAFLCAAVSIYVWREKVVKRREKQRQAVLHMYDTEKGVKELIDLTPFEEKDHGTGIDVPFFDFESILAATNNFSEENKLGKGGFGPVYMGKFPGGEEVAVKRLSSVSGQGLEEFKNEVVLIAKLQHRNLVRLLGYCIKGEEKILLYEYMPNKSLDSLLFGESSSQQLDWATRFNIILGIARGLLYLHQDSRLRIIHRDLKTSNILLDAEMNPKISDFGLARMIQGKQTEANTLRVIGTYGYMAPEYALDGLFSVKSDVFSFGIVVLEIISGKRNMRFYQVEDDAPSLGWRLWQEGKALDLMNERAGSNCNESEFMRCVHVGLLCVQEVPSERPTMGDIVLMLSGTQSSKLPIPKQPAYVIRRPLSATASSYSNAETNTEITSSIEEGR